MVLQVVRIVISRAAVFIWRAWDVFPSHTSEQFDCALLSLSEATFLPLFDRFVDCFFHMFGERIEQTQ